MEFPSKCYWKLPSKVWYNYKSYVIVLYDLFTLIATSISTEPSIITYISVYSNFSQKLRRNWRFTYSGGQKTGNAGAHGQWRNKFLFITLFKINLHFVVPLKWEMKKLLPSITNINLLTYYDYSFLISKLRLLSLDLSPLPFILWLLIQLNSYFFPSFIV